MIRQLKASLSDNFVVNNQAREHLWTSDEPAESGGKDLGPKPTELLLSSLASCKLITMKMYADRKGWKIDDIVIELRMDEITEKTVIHKSLRIEGDLDEQQLERLTVISGRCPIVRMLSNSIEFKMD